MGMTACRGCGKELHDSARVCPQCGAVQGPPNAVKGWSWGAFLLNGIWAIGNNTWIGLLAFIPALGLIMALILGFKGREWAWKNKQWNDIEHFNRVQRKWSLWGVACYVGAFVIGIVAGILVPQYQEYENKRSMREELSKPAAAVESSTQPTAVAPKAQEPVPSVPGSSSIAGLWRGQLEGQGEMEIKSTPDGFEVVLVVAKSAGGADCSGGMGGTTGPMIGNTLTITDKMDEKICTVRIKFSGDTAEVEEENCSYFHGAACGFDGTLKRVK